MHVDLNEINRFEPLMGGICPPGIPAYLNNPRLPCESKPKQSSPKQCALGGVLTLLLPVDVLAELESQESQPFDLRHKLGGLLVGRMYALTAGRQLGLDETHLRALPYPLRLTLLDNDTDRENGRHVTYRVQHAEFPFSILPLGKMLAEPAIDVTIAFTFEPGARQWPDIANWTCHNGVEEMFQAPIGSAANAN